MINTYELGDTPRLTMAFTDADSAPADPTTITLTLFRPDKTTDTYTYVPSPEEEISRESEGIYHMDVLASQAGAWYYRWVGTGDVSTAEEHQFWVSAPRA